MNEPFLSLIIPAYNEAERISTSLDAALEYLSTQQYSWEIVVVDDGSSDDTVRIVRHYQPRVRVIELGQNLGKGAAVRRGMLDARGEYRVFTDADFSTPISELPKILDSLKAGADICIGSRRLDPTSLKKHQPWYREMIGVVGNKIISAVLFAGIEDTQCGFKGMNGQSADLIFRHMKINGFGFDPELLFLCRRAGLVLSQVPVDWYNDERSRLNPIRDSIATLVEILRIKKVHRNTHLDTSS